MPAEESLVEKLGPEEVREADERKQQAKARRERTELAYNEVRAGRIPHILDDPNRGR